MFIDEVQIVVSSGKGGDGAVSFRREKYIPRGGPDGGDGGRGGDVTLRASRHLTTLSNLQPGRHYKARPGVQGGGNHRHGADGETTVLEVPIGTLVRDAGRGNILRDLAEAGAECVVVEGGAGGRGNKHFAHATNQAPRRATEGRPGETRRLTLELRLVADAGLVGLPNAGKSTLLRRVSAARPKVADYPFTTLEPVLGIVQLGDRSLVLADIPGLIEGAHEGAGLGDRFLRHVARTGVLLHLVDGSVGPEAAVVDWRTIRDELRLSGLDLHEKPSLLAVSRADLCDDAEAVARALAEASGLDVLIFSAHGGQGVNRLLGTLLELVGGRAEPAPERPRPLPPHRNPDLFDPDRPGPAAAE